MKKLLLSLFLFGISAGLFAQNIQITSPDNVEETSSTDFYFRDVVYKLSSDQAIGTFTNESGNPVEINLGESPDKNIKNYLDKKYPSSGTKIEMIVSIEKLSVDKSKSNNGDAYYEAEVSMKFYILNGDMMVILGTGNAGVQMKQAADAEALGELIVEAINQAIMDFDASNWKDHPLLQNQKEKGSNQQQEEKQTAYPEQKTVYTVTPKKKRIPEGDYKLNQIIVSGGYSYRLAKIPEGANQEDEDLIMGLKSGLNFDLSYINYFGIDWGMGMILNYSFASSIVNNYPLLDFETEEIYYVDVEETVSVVFVGPCLGTRLLPEPDKKINLNANIGLGYIFYTDEVDVDGIKVEATSNTIGLNMQAALGIDISPAAFLNIKAGYFMASLSAMEIAGRKYQLQERESLNRLDVNLGIGFNF